MDIWCGVYVYPSSKLGLNFKITLLLLWVPTMMVMTTMVMTMMMPHLNSSSQKNKN